MARERSRGLGLGLEPARVELVSAPPEQPAGPAAPAAATVTAAPPLSAALAVAEPATSPAAGALEAQAAVAAGTEVVKCEGCGEPVQPSWRKCPSCLRPLVRPAAPSAAAAAAALRQMERIPARPERDLGIRDQSAQARKERSPRETPLDPEKISILRERISQEKAKGVDIGDIEAYLDSGVVTREGLRIRLEAISEQSKRLEAGNMPAGEAGKAPDAPEPDARQPEEAGGLHPIEDDSPPPQTGEAGQGEKDRRSFGPPGGRGLLLDERPDNEHGGEPAGAANGQAPEGTRKLKKVKKVAK